MKIYPGQKMPNFSFDTPFKAENILYDVIGNRPATIMFLRDSGCLFTAYYLEMMHQNYRFFTDSNRALICVVQGSPSEYSGYSKLKFPLVCDTESVLYKELELPKVTFTISLLSAEALRIISEAKKHHLKYEKSLKSNCQLPVTIMLQSDKTIEHIHRSQSITDIPELLELLGGGMVKPDVYKRVDSI